jgi:DNA-binding NtrC family response regulator
VGGTSNIPVDVRIIAATHKDLSQEVKKGRFREDLFFRLFVVPIILPPLRERKDDIPFLIEHFMDQEFSSGKNRETQKLSPDAMDKLIDYDWPGNVRELKNVINRAALSSLSSTIDVGDIQFAPISAGEMTDHNYDEKTENIPQTVAKSLKDIEKDRIIKELNKYNWNKKDTANALGIAKSTLFDKIKKYNLKKPD